jgi:predicted O-methyltransferase YrrM
MNRLDYFKSRADNDRFWWFRINDYLPAPYADLSDEEFHILEQWFLETERLGMIGECGISMMSTLLGLVNGNGIDAIVECGHYAGYSTLLLGWALRRMGKQHALFSMDIAPKATHFSEAWVLRAGLENQICLRVGSSDDPWMLERAQKYLKTGIKLVFIDSSHEYEHTLNELGMWWAVLEPGGFIVLHDVSRTAQVFDATGLGGVRRAMVEFLVQVETEGMMIGGGPGYQDPYGLGIIQKGTE